MHVGIIGGGTVGHALLTAFAEHNPVSVYDVDATRRTASLSAVLQADVIFVCLPEKLVETWFVCAPRTAAYVIKSTVPIGTTRRIAKTHQRTVHSPEFLTARCAALNASMPTRNIVGHATGVLSHPVEKLYRARWPHVPLLEMQSDASEAVKLIQNALFAMKVAAWNEARSLCNAHSMDWDIVREAILMDGRIHPSHTLVPGPDGERGFGGACLPKDLAAYNEALKSVGLTPRMGFAAQHWSRDAHD